ncbi:cyclic nucleotide-binding domain protein (macronuclear) [Tetrahymena thermophila SB210]|uniref:Cyclic nucleotide-binding domain protein n=1 Tax=Tetrahymena thermophila (strain SB210) TaxID=312017 RepID=W7X0S8_TETTS|nr:cyclic nucleotide-binding domain protein [Tetrahymena thermophila SB210]EWS72770.1 cyclic nucleotide-binding domain protein [Tetrahymena thermophila SB210]|eukprot:XP_012654707.1 cyclic nucleotide-binding domain protein [Tetrahymena thermophila SB210]
MKSNFAPTSFFPEAENDLFQPYKNLVTILQNPSKTLKDAEAIYQQIENHPYIKKFFGENISDKSAALQLCKNMSVQFFKRGDIVMAQGDQSDNKLYVILEGKVGIVINFKGPKPPDGAIYDRDLQEKLEREQQESIQSQEDKIDEELIKRIISIFKKDKEDDKKKYVPFGEEPEMQKRVAINKHLNDLIENKNSILKPKDDHKFTISQSKQMMKNRSSSIFKPPFKQLLMIIQQKKKEKQQKEVVYSHKPSLHLDLEGTQSRSLEKKNSFISPTDTPKARKLQTELQETKEKKYQQQIESFGTKVNEIGKGTGFGDKALLAANPKQAVRNATIICTTPVLCIIVYRKDFLRVVENFSAEAILKEKTITRQFKFFKDVSSTSLKERLLYYFQDINLLKNEYVCKEGEYAEGLYIFAEGKVTLQKKYEDQKNIYYQKYSNISICTIERPTFFCEEVIFSKEEKPKCKYTIQVTSQKAHLYFCSKQNFLYKFPKDAIEELNQFYQARDLSYQQLFDHCKEVQFNNDQIKKQNEKAMNDNAHYMNFQQNKELFTQMKSACIDYQVKKVVPKLIDQFENQQHLVTQNNKIKLNDDFDPTVQDFCSRVDFVMKKNIEEREMVKKIIKQKKIKTDKRTFKQKQSSYKFGKQNSQQISFEEDEIIQSGEESNQNADKKLSVDSEEKIKLLRNIFSKGKKMNLNDIDLNLFYRNQEELYEDSDVNLLLDIRKPKKAQQSYNTQKSQEINDQTMEIVPNIQSIQYPNSPSNKGDSSPTKKNFEFQKYDYSNFEADELKTPPPELNKTQSQLKTKLNQNELDIGYLEMFKKQQYFYMVRKGAIKINHNTEFPQLDLRKKILKKIKKRKSQITDGEKFSHSFCLSPQIKKQQFLNKCASYDIQQQDEVIKINSSNYTDITSQIQNEENAFTDRSDPTIQLNKIFETFQPSPDFRLKHHSVSEIKSPFMKQKNSKKSSFRDVIKSGDKDNVLKSQQSKNGNKGRFSKNTIQITEDFKNLEGLQQVKSDLEAKSQSQIQFNKLEFPNSQESIQCLDKGGFLSPKNNIGSMFYNKTSSDQPLLPYLSCTNEYSTPSSIQTKKQSDIQTNKSQSLTKQDIKLAQINQGFTPTGVGSRLNGLNSCVVQPKIVSAQNSQKKDHQFYLTTRSEEVTNNNAFFGNPNNFQITSFSYQLKQLQQQQQQQQQQQSQQTNQSQSKKLISGDISSVNRANKYLKYKTNQTNEINNLQSAPNLRKSYHQEQNPQQKEFFFKQNFKNNSSRNSQNMTQQLNQTGTQTKNEKSVYPQTVRTSQYNFKIDASKNCEDMNSLQKYLVENNEIYQDQGEDINSEIRTTTKKDICLQTLAAGNFPQNKQSLQGNSSDVSNFASFNQTNGNFTFKNHLKKVFVTRQKIFKAENHLKPNLSYLQPLQNSKELKLSPHFFANTQQQPAK